MRVLLGCLRLVADLIGVDKAVRMWLRIGMSGGDREMKFRAQVQVMAYLMGLRMSSGCSDGVIKRRNCSM